MLIVYYKTTDLRRGEGRRTSPPKSIWIAKILTLVFFNIQCDKVFFVLPDFLVNENSTLVGVG